MRSVALPLATILFGLPAVAQAACDAAGDQVLMGAFTPEAAAHRCDTAMTASVPDVNQSLSRFPHVAYAPESLLGHTPLRLVTGPKWQVIVPFTYDGRQFELKTMRGFADHPVAGPFHKRPSVYGVTLGFRF